MEDVGGGAESSVPVPSATYSHEKWTRRYESPLFCDFLVSEDEFKKGDMIREEDYPDYVRCHLGVQKKTGLTVAMYFYKESPDSQDALMRTARYLARLAHPLIVPLLGIGTPPSRFLVMKFMPNRDLSSILERERGSLNLSPEGWDATAKSKCVFGIAAGMAFIHSKNIIHRHLKPFNVLLDDDFEPVIGGLSAATEYLVAENERSVGAPLFMAPEMIKGGYDHKVDVYSFAVVLYQLFTSTIELDRVWRYRRVSTLLSAVSQGARLKRVATIPDFYWDLICKCWSQDPRDRPSFVEIVKYLRAHTSEYAFEGANLSLVREYERHALESISDVLSGDVETSEL